MTKVPYFHISTFRSIPAVPIMDVFSISLVSCSLATLLGYFVNDFYMASIVPVVTGIAFYLNSTCAILEKINNANKTYFMLQQFF
jgi:hypothetical protein